MNLKPIVPGHVLIVPFRKVERLKELSDEESVDFMMTLQKISQFIEKKYQADALNIAIQDGPEAGQSVPHLHAHIIPRHQQKNFGDEIYRILETSDLEDEFHKRKVVKQHTGSMHVDDSLRVERSMDVMRAEAQELARELQQFK